MEPKYLQMELKDTAEDGTFSGIASVYGVEDLDGDIIDKGAFTKTISENPTIPILWQHDPSEVIGEGSVKEWQGKILVNGKLDMNDPIAQKAHSKMKSKLIKGLSIGFTTIKSVWQDVENRSIRHIQELKLWETSIVTFPALPSAQVTRVKQSDTHEARIKSLEEQIEALRSEVTTLKAEPEATEPQHKNTEPVDDHSAAATTMLSELMALIPDA